MPPLAVVVLLALVAYRATRLVTTDALTVQPRRRLYDWAYADAGVPDAPPEPRAAWRTYVYVLFTCQQCLGVWACAAVVGVYTWQLRPVDSPAAWTLTLAAVAGVQSVLALAADRLEA